MLHRIENEEIKLEISEKGAELQSIFLKGYQKEILYDGNPQFWSRRAPILFPIVGRAKDDRIKVKEKEYYINQHGFARDSQFKLIKKENEQVEFLLNENEKTIKMFPFSFTLIISYKLEKKKITISAKVQNEKEEILPFSIGFHPAFKIPFYENESIEDVSLKFEKRESCKRLILSNGLIDKVINFELNDKILKLKDSLFENDAIILKEFSSKYIIIERSDKKGFKIEVNFEGFPYLGIWKKVKAPFICIEPWFGVNDYSYFNGEIFSKEGILKLKKGDTFHTQFYISFLE